MLAEGSVQDLLCRVAMERCAVEHSPRCRVWWPCLSCFQQCLALQGPAVRWHRALCAHERGRTARVNDRDLYEYSLPFSSSC